MSGRSHTPDTPRRAVEVTERRDTMTRTKLFRSKRLQAVRLPKDVAFPEGVTDVNVLREGKRRVIVPANAVWDDFFDAPGIDLPPREQPTAQERDAPR
jgi:antitoxin VapB